MAAEKLERALVASTAELDKEERTLIELKYTQRLPVREIAARLATSEKAVESRLTRVRQRLRTMTLERLKNETV